MVRCVVKSLVSFAQNFSLLALLCFLGGCSEGDQNASPTVFDSIAQMEKTKKELEVSTVIPPGPTVGEDDAATDPDAVTTGAFKVKFETSAGEFVVLVHRDWAPIGAQRFYELVKDGFYDECRFFRVVSNFMVQFGINGSPDVQQRWQRNIQDDPPKVSNKRSYMTFATSGPNSRTTQVFINFVDNGFLDSQGFAPFGEVIAGMDYVDVIYSGHAENPDQGQITARGNAYLNAKFPELDHIKRATIIEE